MKLSKAISKFDASISEEATRKLYTYSLRSLFDEIGDTKLKAISPDDLHRWRKQLDHVRSTSNRSRGKKLSDYTKHKMMRQVKHFFNWCIERGWLKQSPAALLELPTLPDGEPPKAITDEDLQRLMAVALREILPRDYALLRLLAETGCRLGGLLRLRPEDIELEHRRAWVREKQKKTRQVGFGEQTKLALQAWLVERPCYLKGGSERNKNCQRDDDQLFLGRQGNLTSSGVYRMLQELAIKAGVEGRFNPHSFRHGLARRLLKHDADLGTVSRILGHSDITTTHEFYGCWTQDELMQRHQRYGGILDE